MRAHRRRLFRVTPDLAYVTKYTDQGPYPGNHWFWRDGRRNHGHDVHGQAYVRWVVRPTALSGYRTHGEFNVVRLLFEARVGALPPRARVRNTCGLSQCINPDHWVRIDSRVSWRMQVLETGAWQLVSIPAGRPARRTVAARLVYDGVVHIASIVPLEQRTFAAPRAACGAELAPLETVVTSADVSCARCV